MYLTGSDINNKVDYVLYLVNVGNYTRINKSV